MDNIECLLLSVWSFIFRIRAADAKRAFVVAEKAQKVAQQAYNIEAAKLRKQEIATEKVDKAL